jgi:hypothetical protein
LSACLHSFQAIRFVGSGRKKYYWSLTVYFTNRSREFKADAVGKPEIQKVKIKMLIVGQTNSIFNRSGGDHVEFVFSQNDLYHLTRIFVVFDVEDPVLFEFF